VDVPDTEVLAGRLLGELAFKRAVLIPCTDYWVRVVANLPENLQQRFPSSVPPSAVVDQLVDKRRFAGLLKAHAVPHPITLPLATESDLEKADLSKLAQGFLKPTNSQAFGAHFRKKAFSFSTREEALTRFRESSAAGFEVILQEYIPGPATEHFFLDGFIDREGTFRGRFARRRLRMYPPKFGNSTYLVSVPLDEMRDGVESLERLLTAVRYRGIFSAEFKRDPRNNQLKLLEINARPWWYVGFAVDCGINVVHMAYLDALGLPVPDAKKYSAGVHFVFTGYDGMACRELRADGKLGLLRWGWQWLTAKQALFVWYDPWPSVQSWGIRFGRSLMRHLLRRAVSAI
jgi:predicted ATP-grasp superfamily ATP-dependent carboligase